MGLHVDRQRATGMPAAQDELIHCEHGYGLPPDWVGQCGSAGSGHPADPGTACPPAEPARRPARPGALPARCACWHGWAPTCLQGRPVPPSRRPKCRNRDAEDPTARTASMITNIMITVLLDMPGRDDHGRRARAKFAPLTNTPLASSAPASTAPGTRWYPHQVVRLRSRRTPSSARTCGGAPRPFAP